MTSVAVNVNVQIAQAIRIECPVVPTLCPPPKREDDTGLGGLVALGTGRALPLRLVKVRSEIVGNCARTVVEQRFGNDLSEPIEAVHIFPLPPAGAVVEMELHAGDTVVVADCREKEEATRTFEAARQSGHRAALLTQERADVHTLRVTRIPPGAEIRVRIVVIQAIESQDGLFRWRFPTVVAPRYHSGTPVGHSGPGTAADTDRVPDASRISPPIRLAGGTELDLEVEVRGPVSEISASSHAVAMKMGGGNVRVAPAGNATLDRDFVLAFGLADAQETALRAFTDGHCTLVVACAPRDRVPAAVPRDAVFVVDISGSMDGEKMVSAKAAITAALHGLLPGDRFRVIAFDDSLEHFRPDFVEYGDATLTAADAWIDRLAPRGGTEMLPAIQAALAGATPAGRMRTVLFVTDGQASNDQELVAAVANRRGTARFFTLGIDTAVNEALMTRLARVGGGVCEIATPQDDIEETVARLESRFGLPLVDGLVVENGDPARPEPAVLFAGRPATLLLAGAPEKVVVRGQAPGGEFRAEAVPVRVEFPLSALWARERIGYLEDRLVLKPLEEEALRPEILRLGLAHHLATRFTAFVAVERQKVVGTPGDVKEIVQPVELPQGWSENFRGGGLGGAHGGFGASTGAMPPPPASPAPMRPVMMPSPRAAAMAPPPAPSMMAPGGPRFDMDEAAEPAPSMPAAQQPSAAPKGGLGGLVGKAKDMLSRKRSAPPPPPPAEAEAEEPWDDEADDVAFSAADGLFESAREEKASKTEAGRLPDASQVAATLAKSQKADGSFGGDALRTAAALLALVLLGNTRRAGPRSRVVMKAATWLDAHRGVAGVAAALEALEAAERGVTPKGTAAWDALRAAGAEGTYLALVEGTLA
jgi:Ca-activated chloride channel family protein